MEQQVSFWMNPDDGTSVLTFGGMVEGSISGTIYEHHYQKAGNGKFGLEINNMKATR